MEILGIDIGGSGIKAALVDTNTGELVSERYKVTTPSPSDPENISLSIKELIDHFNWDGIVGCSFPTVVKFGKSIAIGNLSPEWMGVHVGELFGRSSRGKEFYVGNDADLAGIAEMKFGTGKDLKGKVIMVTIGTGLGTGLFYNSTLIPNLELGHLFHTDGRKIELYAADSARKRENLELHEWAERFNFFLNHVVRLFSPDHFIIGGGLSKKFEEFKSHLTVDVPVHVAKTRNNAGIIGAAVFAENRHDLVAGS